MNANKIYELKYIEENTQYMYLNKIYNHTYAEENTVYEF